MKKELYLPYFKNKKITVMGLGTLGRGIKVTQFLSECGAKLTVTDLKTKEELAESVKKLSKNDIVKNITYRLGGHDIKDFNHKDLILKSAGVPLDSEYIKEAEKNHIPISMDAALFLKITKDLFDAKKITNEIKVIAITGTKGKSTTTALIYHLLKTNEQKLGGKVWLGGNMRNCATLPLLTEVEGGDIVVLEIDSWQAQGFAYDKISPHISVLTSFFEDHLNYYKGDMKMYAKDKLNLFAYQTKNDMAIIPANLKRITFPRIASKIVRVKSGSKIASAKSLFLQAPHNQLNIALAATVAQNFGLIEKEIKKALNLFQGLEGRLQELEVPNGVRIINDNNASTPEATARAIEALAPNNIYLICGGADKNLQVTPLTKALKKVTAAYILPGKGSERLIGELIQSRQTYTTVKDIDEALKLILLNKLGKKDVILFSPGFASFGQFKNEYERNDTFLRLVAKYRKKMGVVT